MTRLRQRTLEELQPEIWVLEPMPKGTSAVSALGLSRCRGGQSSVVVVSVAR